MMIFNFMPMLNYFRSQFLFPPFLICGVYVVMKTSGMDLLFLFSSAGFENVRYSLRFLYLICDVISLTLSLLYFFRLVCQ